MKCGLCRESGHNRATCPKNPPHAPSRLPTLPPDELMRLLIESTQVLELVIEGTAADALANATRRIGEYSRDGLGHLVCNEILVALAELDLRAKRLDPAMRDAVRTTYQAIDAAEQALEAARREHARAKAEVLLALGYREKVKEMGFEVGLVDAEASL